MPEVNPKVMAMVEEEVRKNPKVANTELRKKAEKIDKAIADLEPRKFNGLYTLQVKRRLAPRKKRAAGVGRPRRQAAAQAVDRNAVRGVLLQFAKDIAAAEGKADMVEVIGGVDRYVDRVVKVAGGA